MFERFTDAARSVVSDAVEQARARWRPAEWCAGPALSEGVGVDV